jgi:hypothetical protein
MMDSIYGITLAPVKKGNRRADKAAWITVCKSDSKRGHLLITVHKSEGRFDMLYLDRTQADSLIAMLCKHRNKLNE